jgi:class 3 adenylate cyclase
VALERAVESHGTLGGEPLRVRVGLHVGEALREADDLFGLAVIVAARIADLARGGEILVSAAVRDHARGQIEMAFDGGRVVRLKGVAGTQRIHGVLWREDAAGLGGP